MRRIWVISIHLVALPFLVEHTVLTFLFGNSTYAYLVCAGLSTTTNWRTYSFSKQCKSAIKWWSTSVKYDCTRFSTNHSDWKKHLRLNFGPRNIEEKENVRHLYIYLVEQHCHFSKYISTLYIEYCSLQAVDPGHFTRFRSPEGCMPFIGTLHW